jgi:hypothetical protein
VTRYSTSKKNSEDGLIDYLFMRTSVNSERIT